MPNTVPRTSGRFWRFQTSSLVLNYPSLPDLILTIYALRKEKLFIFITLLVANWFAGKLKRTNTQSLIILQFNYSNLWCKCFPLSIMNCKIYKYFWKHEIRMLTLMFMKALNQKFCIIFNRVHEPCLMLYTWERRWRNGSARGYLYASRSLILNIMRERLRKHTFMNMNNTKRILLRDESESVRITEIFSYLRGGEKHV